MTTDRCVSDCLADTAARVPDRAAIVWNGQTITNAALEHRVASLAGFLKDIGVAAGDRVAILIPNCPLVPEALLAILRAGAIAVNLSMLDAPAQTLAKVRATRPVLLIVADEAHLIATAGLLLDEALVETILLPAGTRLPAGPAWRHIGEGRPIPPGTPRAHGQPAILQFTGGTTGGPPKAAMMTHATIGAGLDQIDDWCDVVLARDSEILPLAAPLSFSAAIIMLLHSIGYGSTVLLHARADIDALMQDFLDRGATWMLGVPTLYQAILDHPRAALLQSCAMKLYCVGSAPVPLTLMQRFRDVTGSQLVEAYALSECVPAISTPPDAVRPGSCGKAVHGARVRIIDPARPGIALPPGAEGEIQLASPAAVPGYWERPELAADLYDGEWLRTGDIGRMDADGYVTIVDRLKDVIITSGVNVYPRTVEEALLAHDGIAQAAVVGLPDDYRGEIVTAFIVPRGGTSLDESELLGFLGHRLSRHELPRRIEWRSELPLTQAGKINRRGLVAS